MIVRIEYPKDSEIRYQLIECAKFSKSEEVKGGKIITVGFCAYDIHNKTVDNFAFPTGSGLVIYVTEKGKTIERFEV